MKRLRIMFLAAMTIAILNTSALAEQAWSPNLLLKADAEAKLDDEWGVWKGGFDRISSFADIFPHRGNFLFWLKGTVKLTQDIDVSDYASIIDKGNAEVKFGAWFIRGEGASECSFRTQYYDENAAYLTEDSETIACDAAKWSEQQTFKTIPPGTRNITAEIRIINPGSCGWNGHDHLCDVLLDDAYFQISGTSSSAPSADTSGAGSTSGSSETSGETGTTPGTHVGNALSFKDIKPFYNIGELVVIDLEENLQATRFNRVDLWVVIQPPNNADLLFMTELAFNPFDRQQQAFRKSLDTTQTTHRVLEFEVLPGLGGDYFFYAVYVQEGKNPITDGFFVQRSNVAMTKIVLSNE
ncbi:MAG: hypothetical protein VSS75_019505 [Candidatus Parabeggiatoa sp.]|nr:hypothetical protein [Candidatus Parabeggiatoa sp.]